VKLFKQPGFSTKATKQILKANSMGISPLLEAVSYRAKNHHSGIHICPESSMNVLSYVSLVALSTLNESRHQLSLFPSQKVLEYPIGNK
jgi:hypothetical protein